MTTGRINQVARPPRRERRPRDTPARGRGARGRAPAGRLEGIGPIAGATVRAVVRRGGRARAPVPFPSTESASALGSHRADRARRHEDARAHEGTRRAA